MITKHDNIILSYIIFLLNTSVSIHVHYGTNPRVSNETYDFYFFY